MDPLLIEVPGRIDTARLALRMPRAGDGPALNAAVRASVELLRPWAAWATPLPSVAESESYCRQQHARFILRTELVMLIYERGSDGHDGPVLGATALHAIDWVARRFELGYWRRVGLDGWGVAGEAVEAMTRMAMERLDAQRIEIRMDEDNLRSRRVAERAGYAFEQVLHVGSEGPGAAKPSGTCIYARLAPA